MIEEEADVSCSLLTRDEAPAARIDRIDLDISPSRLVEVVVVAVIGDNGKDRESGDSPPAGLDEMTIASKTPASS